MMIWIIAVLALLLAAMSVLASVMSLVLAADLANAVEAVVTKLEGAQDE